ncbi:hypothetical protein [Mucilaginibacter gotjawali]|uniref:Uncharacterized protein n=2 Tax=Mucilaginibacter gotjawali TaxID=1550579 RepID=A0A0X8X2T2_9SPHI|nr:hypothetical protein [Mucilaginibacter gotjawali]MBB3055898.1 hypothetical protein [Mucilaginibacter gotjawali]BAU54720.1 hypothetical protein MgSA37_02898 [Mucilaginibacter gotjawali]
MSAKFKLMCWFLLSAWFATTRAQTTKQPIASPRLLIIGSYYAADSGGEYEVLRAFIINYSDDTLRFWGSNCQPSEFFKITINGYMHLVDEECKKSVFQQIAIPPHRSLLIPLKLTVSKQPHELIQIKVSMSFYKCYASNHFTEDRKNHRPEILTDTITLNYNKDGNPFYGKSDWEELKQKEKINLPTTKLYLLTADDLKHYTVTADVTKITKADEDEYSYTKEKVFQIPVTVHNNSDKTLRYYSMSCSWQEFYHIDNKNLEIVEPPCDNNVPKEVIVPAHSARTDIVPFIYKKSQKIKQRFRVGLNINKNVEEDLFEGYDDELRIYNVVWSNEVTFVSK